MTARLQLCAKGYSIDHMVPWQRQKRDIDAEADDGEVAVQQPADHLESLRRPRPSVHPGRLGGDQLVSAAAATHGRCAPQLLTEAVHLGSTRRGEWTQSEEKTPFKHPSTRYTYYTQVSSRVWPTFAGEMS